MTIEIHQPALEALIQKRMASGRFQSVEDLLLQSLEAVPEEVPKPVRQNFLQFIKESLSGVRTLRWSGRKIRLGRLICERLPRRHECDLRTV